MLVLVHTIYIHHTPPQSEVLWLLLQWCGSLICSLIIPPCCWQLFSVFHVILGDVYVAWSTFVGMWDIGTDCDQSFKWLVFLFIWKGPNFRVLFEYLFIYFEASSSRNNFQLHFLEEAEIEFFMFFLDIKQGQLCYILCYFLCYFVTPVV